MKQDDPSLEPEELDDDNGEDNLLCQVREAVLAGRTDSGIVKDLVGLGVNEDDAERLVFSVAEPIRMGRALRRARARANIYWGGLGLALGVFLMLVTSGAAPQADLIHLLGKILLLGGVAVVRGIWILWTTDE